MFIKVRTRIFLVGLLVLSGVSIFATFFPLAYFVVFPPPDLKAIVQAMEGHGTTPPLQTTVDFQRKLTEAGSLRRAIPVGYYSGISGTFRVNSSQVSKIREATYLAWFPNLPKPILITVESVEQEGGLRSYEIDEGEYGRMIRGYGLPLLIFGFLLYFVRRKKSPVVKDSAQDAK